jgi:hypothetical protein
MIVRGNFQSGRKIGAHHTSDERLTFKMQKEPQNSTAKKRKVKICIDIPQRRNTLTIMDMKQWVSLVIREKQIKATEETLPHSSKDGCCKKDRR